MSDHQRTGIELSSGHPEQATAGSVEGYVLAAGDPATGYVLKLDDKGLDVALPQTVAELRRRWEFLNRAKEAKANAQCVQDPTATDDLIQGTSKLIGAIDGASVRELMTAVVEGTIVGGGTATECALAADWLDTLNKFSPVDGIVFGEVCREYRDAEKKSNSVIIGMDGALGGLPREAVVRSLVRLNHLKLLGSEKLENNRWGLNIDVLGVEICEGVINGSALTYWEERERKGEERARSTGVS